jgi:hypothetical protein
MRNHEAYNLPMNIYFYSNPGEILYYNKDMRSWNNSLQIKYYCTSTSLCYNKTFLPSTKEDNFKSEIIYFDQNGNYKQSVPIQSEITLVDIIYNFERNCKKLPSEIKVYGCNIIGNNGDFELLRQMSLDRKQISQEYGFSDITRLNTNITPQTLGYDTIYLRYKTDMNSFLDVKNTLTLDLIKQNLIYFINLLNEMLRHSPNADIWNQTQNEKKTTLIELLQYETDAAIQQEIYQEIHNLKFYKKYIKYKEKYKILKNKLLNT